MLPLSIKNKLQALNKIQLEILNKEVEFNKRVYSMETEFQKTLGALYEKRKQIIAGAYEPIKQDLLDPEEFETTVVDSQSKGIPEFWLTIFKKVPLLQSMIWESDEPALKHLVDIRVVMHDQPKQGFVLLFQFEPNDFFTNEQLTKQYLMECSPSCDELSQFNGFKIYDTIGCDIDWKEGCNLTARNGTEVERMLSSFFNFFQPNKLQDVNDPIVRKQLLETDFEIGYFIKEELVPRAVMFYNSDMGDDDEDLLDDVLTVPDETSAE